jgi:hypothetical protein
MIKHVLVSDRSEQETFQTNVYLYRPYCEFNLNIVISLNNFVCTPNPVRFYNTFLLLNNKILQDMKATPFFLCYTVHNLGGAECLY